ncbi:MAG: NAD(P)-dependent oxidoreductase [Candidatus Pacebacteria bacterium]|nr:NAD(P)-dependent oxidoreductase [Candidatus Paceibacterota bacterium]
MKAAMQRFTKLSKSMPTKRGASSRGQDFNEIYGEFNPAEAQAQAARCAQCGVPFCQVHCPLHNNIPDWLMLAASGRLEEAYQVSQATNSFPEICGRICPQDRLCEGNCVIETGFESVSIGAIEKYITDMAFEQGWVTSPEPRQRRDSRVAIVGSGPAGLAAAESLCSLGHQVTVFERADRVGGLLIYGIPNFKLDKSLVTRRTELLAAGGVEFKTNMAVGKEISLAELRSDYDAVLLATGVYRARTVELVGRSLEGIVPALDYLIANNRAGLGDRLEKSLDAKGKRVIVIGGGDTAMDCVRTAVRQEAKEVTCLYRRDRENMPGSQREVQNAEEEGVHFEWLSAPEGFMAVGSGSRVGAVAAHRIHLGVVDGSGRQVPTPIADSRFIQEADLVIEALGFDAEDFATEFGTRDLAVTRSGTIQTREGKATSLPGVFAAGDNVRGASLVVWAIRDGRDAATEIHSYLQSHSRSLAAE